MDKIKNIIILMRTHQYIKNILIFMPILFAGKITNLELLVNTIVAFIAFSATASAIYILNDYKDIKADQIHPIKKFRPLAAGTISKKNAILLMSILFAIGITVSTILSISVIAILSIYIVINIIYTHYTKHIAILDVTSIAIGFVLRLFVGSIASAVILSEWIIIMTFLLALFLAFAKRRDDVLLLNNTSKKMRKSIDGYNLQLIDAIMTIMASVVIVAYILYTTSADFIDKSQNEYLYITALFVILGIMRYLQISFVENNSASPTRIVIKDRFMQVVLIMWILFFIMIIYL